MAKLDISGFNEFTDLLLKQDKIAMEAVPEMLEGAGEVVKQILVQSIIEKNFTKSGKRAFGDLKASIGVTKTQGKGDEQYVEVYPMGTDRKGVDNAKKGFVLNFGRSNMAAKPWFSDVKGKIADAGANEMRRIWEAKQREGR